VIWQPGNLPDKSPALTERFVVHPIVGSLDQPIVSSGLSRFLCLGGFFRLSWWGCAAGGEPTHNRAWRLTSVVLLKGLGFLRLIMNKGLTVNL